MNDAQAHAQATAYPHLNAVYFAFYAGKNAADYGGKCEFTCKELQKAFYQGKRDFAAEARLNADTEWDNE